MPWERQATSDGRPWRRFLGSTPGAGMTPHGTWIDRRDGACARDGAFWEDAPLDEEDDTPEAAEASDNRRRARH